MTSLLSILLATVCLCGEAPERANDFFWENDHTGFRAYGPGDVHKWSGIDVFNKNTSSNVVHGWLRKIGPRVKWHKNVNGLGMDDYAVGPGRGVGGVALRKGGQWLADYGNWKAYRVLANCDERCAFELDYALPIGGTMTLAIEMKRGSSLFREKVSFSKDTPLEGVEVGVGLDLNAERLHVGDTFVDEKRGIVSLYEKPHVDKNGKPVKGEEGSTMSAIAAISGYASMADDPTGAKLLMTKPLEKSDANGRPVLEVAAGADWSEAKRYATPETWHNYVRNFGDIYLDLAEVAANAYSSAHLAQYIADVEREGVQEHGFPRLASCLGYLVANGRCLERRGDLERMMTLSCKCAAKGVMPPKSGGNDFSVKELVEAIVALEKAKVFTVNTTEGWRKTMGTIVAENCYKQGKLKLGAPRPHNWVVFACASEQSRIRHGMGGSRDFVERYVNDQLAWFDSNGMYRDAVNDPPAVYDMVTRLQFAQILFDGFDGASRGRLEAMMEKSAEPTLMMLSASGEIPCGGRSNQFLHNNTFYAALCEWYAAKEMKRGNLARARRFKAAARKAAEAILPWLAETPVLHVKNRYPREEGKEVYSDNGDMGCERYAYFDKYMVTMGTWAMLARKFAVEIPEGAAEESPKAAVFSTSPEFGFHFMSAGDYSAQFLDRANDHYDCVGLGRVHRKGAPIALCLSVPCTKHPVYRIEKPNETTLAIVPVVKGEAKMVLKRSAVEGDSAVFEWALGEIGWNCRLAPAALDMTVEGKGEVALVLPAFAFDGREATKIEAKQKSLTIAYRGWKCVYTTDGEIVDTGKTACNRNGRYRRFVAKTSGVGNAINGKLSVKIEIVPERGEGESCRSVSSFDFALISRDNKPCSVCHASINSEVADKPLVTLAKSHSSLAALSPSPRYPTQALPHSNQAMRNHRLGRTENHCFGKMGNYCFCNLLEMRNHRFGKIGNFCFGKLLEMRNHRLGRMGNYCVGRLLKMGNHRWRRRMEQKVTREHFRGPDVISTNDGNRRVLSTRVEIMSVGSREMRVEGAFCPDAEAI